MSQKIKLGLIFGGQSAEHEISLKSARSIDQFLDKTKYEISYIGISKKGGWRKSDELKTAINNLNNPTKSLNIFTTITGLDIVFPILHGPYGEDGKIQGLFDMFHIPYVGCDLGSSFLGMDKVYQKMVLRSAGLPVLDFYKLKKFEWQQDQPQVLSQIKNRLKKYPLIIKPACLGSSVGISKADNQSTLKSAIENAFSFGDKVIIEKCLNHPREIELAVLGNDRITVSMPGEIVARQDFYSYDAKYDDPASQLIIPAKLPKNLITQFQQIAQTAYQTLGCNGLSRVDLFLDPHSLEFWINEINTMPGFTNISMYPKLMEYAGISFPNLIDRLIELGFQKTKN